MRLRLFLDFDGTVTAEDVGNAFFRTFGGAVCDAHVERYRAGLISARECFRAETQAIGLLDVAAAGSFARSRTVDAGLRGLLAFCHESGIECLIVSDGLDFYIREILQEQGLGHAEFVSNLLRFGGTESGGKAAVSVEFPHDDAECDRCACCKRNVMLSRTPDEEIIVYVGDGFSDRCVVQYADVVFAKGELQTFCRERNISYYPYMTLEDVRSRLARLQEAQRVRRPRRAHLLRRELYDREP